MSADQQKAAYELIAKYDPKLHPTVQVINSHNQLVEVPTELVNAIKASNSGIIASSGQIDKTTATSLTRSIRVIYRETKKLPFSEKTCNRNAHHLDDEAIANLANAGKAFENLAESIDHNYTTLTKEQKGACFILNAPNAFQRFERESLKIATATQANTVATALEGSCDIPSGDVGAAVNSWATQNPNKWAPEYKCD